VAESRKSKQWETISKLIPGEASARACMQRWFAIQQLPGLEYKSIALEKYSGMRQCTCFLTELQSPKQSN